ncbi:MULTISPECIES: SRPBCC family protein [unclassified Kribbella]|uniref:SRPBCC family protein n=1 Tax=unclassified Kribbella TaxID=2644121 RepID=UPI003077CD72
MSTSRHLSTHIDRTAQEVYEYASNPANAPEWAAGLAGSIEQVDGDWVADSPMGRIVVKFAESNEYGVLDHTVTLPSGESVYNPMRVIADGDGCEVVFTVRRRADMTEDDFARDADAVQADLVTLKNLLEGS